LFASPDELRTHLNLNLAKIAGVAVKYLDSNKKIIFPTSGVTSGQYLSVELDSEISCDNSPGAVGSIYL